MGHEEATDSTPTFHQRRAGGQVGVVFMEVAGVRGVGDHLAADDRIPRVEAIVNPRASQTGGRAQIRSSSDTSCSTTQDQVLGLHASESHADLIEELAIGLERPGDVVLVIIIALEDGVPSVGQGMADDRNGRRRATEQSPDQGVAGLMN